MDGKLDDYFPFEMLPFQGTGYSFWEGITSERKCIHLLFLRLVTGSETWCLSIGGDHPSTIASRAEAGIVDYDGPWSSRALSAAACRWDPR